MAANNNEMVSELSEDSVYITFNANLAAYELDMPLNIDTISDGIIKLLLDTLTTKSDIKKLFIYNIPNNEESCRKIAEFFKKHQDLNIDELHIYQRDLGALSINNASILFAALKNHKSIVKFKPTIEFVEFDGVYHNWNHIIQIMQLRKYQHLPEGWDQERVNTFLENSDELMRIFSDYISGNETLKEFNVKLLAPFNTDDYLVMLARALGKNNVLEKLILQIGERSEYFNNCDFMPEAFFTALREANCNLKELVLHCQTISMEKRGAQSIISFFEKSKMETFVLNACRTPTDTLSFKGGADEAYDYVLSEIVTKSKYLKSLTFNRPIISENHYHRHHIEKVDRLVAALKKNKTLEQFSFGQNSVDVEFYEFLKENNTLQYLQALVKKLISWETRYKLFELIYLNTRLKHAEFMFEKISNSTELLGIANALARNDLESQAITAFHHDIRNTLSDLTTFNPEHGVLQLVTSYLGDDSPFEEIFPRVTFLYEGTQEDYNDKLALGRSMMLVRAKEEEEREKAALLKNKASV